MVVSGAAVKDVVDVEAVDVVVDAVQVVGLQAEHWLRFYKTSLSCWFTESKNLNLVIRMSWWIDQQVKIVPLLLNLKMPTV